MCPSVLGLCLDVFLQGDRTVVFLVQRMKKVLSWNGSMDHAKTSAPPHRKNTLALEVSTGQGATADSV